jgi:hypothetical protein
VSARLDGWAAACSIAARHKGEALAVDRYTGGVVAVAHRGFELILRRTQQAEFGRTARNLLAFRPQ